MVQILVDSSSDYSLEEIKEKQIDLIPISITIGEKTYRDGYDIGRDEFYEVLQKSSDFPKTSQPSPQAFLDIFMQAKEKGDEIVCILLSSELSGTYQSALLAKTMADYDGIYLVDSRSATYTIKIMADHGCRLRREGLSGKDIAENIEALKARVKVVAALDTLEYLAKGGRLSKTTAAIGDLARVKPIITLTEEGKIGILGKCLGKNKAICSILKQVNELQIDDTFPVYPIYSYGTANCSALEEKFSREGIVLEEHLQIGSTIGTHIGPGAFGIVFVSK